MAFHYLQNFVALQTRILQLNPYLPPVVLHGASSSLSYHQTIIITGSVCVCNQLLSCVYLFATPWTIDSLPGFSVHGIFQAIIIVLLLIPGKNY